MYPTHTNNDPEEHLFG